MLTKEVALGFSPAKYPTYEYLSKSGKRRITANLDGSRIVPPPKGHREGIRFTDADEHFADYLKWLEDEHTGIPSSEFLQHPGGIFIGRWRNARWIDEAKRRNLA